MKNIKYFKQLFGVLLFSCLLLTSQSCQKSFLNVPLQNQQPAVAFFQNATDAGKAVNAMYANLREWTNIAFAPIAVESIGSDDAEKGSSPNDASFFNNYDTFTVTAGDGQLLDFWHGQYQTINLANVVLDNVPGVNMDATLKARYLAEAKFIRAYSYFRLVRAFGDVPLRLTVPKTSAAYNITRSPKADVYAAIEADLTDAATVLPQTYAAIDIGHATKGAALALHAKVSMYQMHWTDVVTFTTQIMGMGYTLYPNFEQLFRYNNKNNSESIFEVQCMLVPGNGGASNSQYSQVQGVRGSTGGGWGFNVPTLDLANEFEANDPRKSGTIIFRGTTTPEGDPIPAIGDNPMYNMKSYVPFSQFVSGFNEGCMQNKIVLRYAEVLLMNAEASNELGNTTQALASLELVRARARQGNNTILPKVTTTVQTALRTAIYHERRVEMGMEFDRYFDVIRQGRAGTIFGPKGWKANKNEVWPIPQNEIDLSAGLLTQNPGY
jgi:starch-binding outer membrane protein, SusD/RagB family